MLEQFLGCNFDYQLELEKDKLTALVVSDVMIVSPSSKQMLNLQV